MVLGYDYSNRNRRRRRTNAPPLQAISMAMAVRRCDTERIARWRRSRDFIKATKLCHRATTCSVLPRRPPGTQSTQRWATCPPPLLAISMAVAMRQYNTARIAQWRRFMAFVKATKRHHPASTGSDSINRTRQRRLLLLFHREKGLQSTCWPRITIGVWHIKLMRSTWLT